MAAVSTAPVASASSLTPPSSSHGNHNAWHFAVPSSQQDVPYSKTNDLDTNQPPHMNGGVLRHSNSRPDILTRRTDTFNSSRSAEGAYLAPARLNALQHKDSSLSETGSAPDSLLDLYGGCGNMSVGDHFVERSQHVNGDSYADAEDPEHSRWIHRDKLAKIESQELQQAGIILPRTRATSKSSRRDASRDQQGNGIRSEQAQKRQRIDSIPNEVEESEREHHQWDLRTPEEAAEDQGDPYKELNGKQGVSRIPVCKTSPAPIALTHLERDTPMRRRMSNGISGEEESLVYSKVRGRRPSVKTLEDKTATPTSATSPPVAIRKTVPESPTKKTPTRVTSTSGNRSASAAQRPKTRSGRDASGPRPSTRSGEIGAVSAIRPEGDPPWLASMYKPDPMLPPDQQLLPTVAKRLQQEQWEREGKFGTAYDTQFRPLNDEQPKARPESMVLLSPPEIPELKPQETETEKDAQWPLKSLPPKSPTLSTGPRPGTAGQQTYSVMPKIHTGIPQGVGPLPSPRPPVRLQEAPEGSKKEGCGCCVVM